MELSDEIEAITATFPCISIRYSESMNSGELQLSMTAITLKFIWENYPLPIPDVHISPKDLTSKITTSQTSHVIQSVQQEMQQAAEVGGATLLAGLFLAQELDAELYRAHDMGSPAAAAPIPSPIAAAAAAAPPPAYESQPGASSPSDTSRPHVHITSGPKFTVKKSVFQAHVAEIHSSAEVQAMMYQLCQDKHIAKATHNMRAWRFTDARDVLVMDNDDDGEDAAGGRLAMLLDLMKVDGAMVVVSRWYGGVKLGPARFKHINNVARELLEAEGLSRR